SYFIYGPFALQYLAECHANREKMKGELGKMLSLQNVIQNFSEMNSRRRKAQFFLGTTNKHAKTVRNLCEVALLKIKGIISFTSQMAVQRCVALASAIASTQVMKAQQVVKSESGEEML
ncbi:hypothetical protein JEQ12_017193, partial [Ovis aries]